MECMMTTSVSVLINGIPPPEFKLERGLHQGDLLSPFLFLIVAEGLNLLVNRAVQSGLLEAIGGKGKGEDLDITICLVGVIWAKCSPRCR